MDIDVYILAYNEAEIITYTLRHYATFARRIVVYDAFSTDKTRDICKEYGAEIVEWETNGLDDMQAKFVKQTAWKGTDANWAICVDADELFYFPHGVFQTLSYYDMQNLHVIKPRGFEMTSDVYPTTDQQIYDEVKMGGRDDYWYAKPVCFAPQRIESIEFGAGAHVCEGILKGGKRFKNPTQPSEPPSYLLHYHHIGPIDRIAARYDATRKRLSPTNVKNRFGNFDPGMKHAQDKRALIAKTLHQVIP